MPLRLHRGTRVARDRPLLVGAVELREVAKKVPEERLLIETDSPYLAPVPFRGKPNLPQYVSKVAECIAQLRNISVDELAALSSRNFFDLFSAAVPVRQG